MFSQEFCNYLYHRYNRVTAITKRNNFDKALMNKFESRLSAVWNSMESSLGQTQFFFLAEYTSLLIRKSCSLPNPITSLPQNAFANLSFWSLISDRKLEPMLDQYRTSVISVAQNDLTRAIQGTTLSYRFKMTYCLQISSNENISYTRPICLGQIPFSGSLERICLENI